MKIHLDTDIGGDIDDLCALAMLLKWKDAEIVGITTVAEENGKRAGYTKRVLELAQRNDIPVAAGADVSLGCYRFKPGYPNEEDYWGMPIPASSNSLDDALELLKNSIEQGAVIAAIGPYTNLALLDKKYPGILQKAKLFLMGGLIFPVSETLPQWGNDMDYNIQLDTNSAKYVFEHSNPTLVTMTITLATSLRRAYLESLNNSDEVGKLIAKQAEAFSKTWNNEEKYGKTCKGIPTDTINFQYDPLTCAIALGWKQGVKIEKIPLVFKMKDGFFHEEIESSGKLTNVVTAADASAFNEFWFQTVIS